MVEEVVETIEEVIAIPGKKLEEIGISLPKYDIDLTVKTPTPPSKTLPPPPPPPVQPKSSLFPPADQKLELPSFSFTTILDEPKKTVPPLAKQTPPPSVPATPQFPAVELPKIALPKVTIPELPKPTASAPPREVVTTKPSVPKSEKKKDNYMFTEAALKEFIQKDKPLVTELDKQQEEERRAREARNAEISRAAEAAIAAFKGGEATTTPKAPVKPVASTVKTIVPKETPISVPPVKGRPTISLFGLGGGAPKTESVTTVATTTTAPPKAKAPTLTVAKVTTSAAPRGVPTISKWKLDPSDNSISGIISGSSSFKDGEPVTTSAVVGQVASNSVVRTKSGSR